MKRAIVFVSGALLVASASTALAAGDAAAGKAKYDLFCTTCHGATGKGDGPGGAALNPKPRDYSDQAWQKATKDEQIFKVIKEGGPAVGKSPLMAAWGAALSDADINNLVAYVRQLGKAK
jgi:mono/diheme cytochrome c family protein